MRPESSTSRMTSRVMTSRVTSRVTSRTSMKTGRMHMTSRPISVTSEKTDVSTDGSNPQPTSTALAIWKEKK